MGKTTKPIENTEKPTENPAKPTGKFSSELKKLSSELKNFSSEQSCNYKASRYRGKRCRYYSKPSASAHAQVKEA